MGKQLLGLGVLLACVAVSVLGAPGDKDSKLAQLRNLISGSNSYIIELDSKSYKYFVEESPRPYTMVILYYSANSETSDIVYEEMKFAAQHFKDQNTHLTQKVGKEMRRPIFFAALKFSQDTLRIYKDLDFRGVPNILVSTAKEISFKDPLDKKMYQRQYLWEIQPSDGLITAKKLVVWLADKTGVKVQYQESIYTFLESMVYFIIFIAIVWFLYIQLAKILMHPLFWLFIFFVGYYVSCAGLVYCILNNARWVGEKDGQPEYVDPSSRGQFISEGLMMSASICGVGLLWILFLKVGDYISNTITKKIVYAVIMYGIYFLVGEVEEIFRQKNSYQPYFLPPGHYKKGSLRLDQGHTV